MMCDMVGFVRVSGGIPAILKLLKSESSMVREAATQALCSLTDDNHLNVL